MGFYASRVFPRLMNALMSAGTFSSIRREALAGVEGDTLEIGFGTGLNLPHYPPALGRLAAIDINPGMSRIAMERIRKSGRDVDFRILDGPSLPYDDASFDSVVSTWTLCSISDLPAALAEVCRILKPDGRFFFVEHGLGPEPHIRKWQHRCTPLQMRIAGGCHLNRDIGECLRQAGFSIGRLETFYMEKAPRIAGFLYAGFAVRP